MALGTFPNVPLEDRVYVDVDGHDGWVYVRYQGGVEIAVTDAEVEAMKDQWRFYYSSAALDQLRQMFINESKESV